MIGGVLFLAAADVAGASGWATVAPGAANLLAAVALLAGIFFLSVGAAGVFRFPDAYHRLHASSKCTTLGLTGMLLAMCLHIAEPVVVSKAIITMVFTFVATPIGSHLIAKAAHHAKMPMWDHTLSDELAEDKANPRMSASDDFIGAPGLDGPGEFEPRLTETDGRGAA